MAKRLKKSSRSVGEPQNVNNMYIITEKYVFDHRVYIPEINNIEIYGQLPILIT